MLGHGCIIKELLGSLAAPCFTTRLAAPTPFSIASATAGCHARRLARRFGDVLASSFQHCLRHYSLHLILSFVPVFIFLLFSLCPGKGGFRFWGCHSCIQDTTTPVVLSLVVGQPTTLSSTRWPFVP